MLVVMIGDVVLGRRIGGSDGWVGLSGYDERVGYSDYGAANQFSFRLTA